MRNIALKLMYNGTAYHGWQVQKNAVTVCGTLEKAIASIPSMPNLTDKQKAEMIDGLKSGLATVEKARPSAENLAIVKKHVSSIKPLYKQWTSL